MSPRPKSGWRIALGLAGAVGVAIASGSCTDPVHQQQIDALGPEASGVPEGEYHRAGQPCVVCHQESGPAKQEFSIAGTVFFGPSTTPASGVDQAEVLLVDSLGSSPLKKVLTNCVGNFFLTPDDWNPAFPVKVGVKKGDSSQTMNSQISRDGSCASCHKDPANFDSPGHVRLNATDANVQIANDCAVNPQIYVADPQASTTQSRSK